MAIRSKFIPGVGIVFTNGDVQDNDIFIGRNAAGQLFVNGGAIPILGGMPMIANTGLIQVFGRSGTTA